MLRDLRLTRPAAIQIRDADEWWAQNRERAPMLFREELREALREILDTPGIGECYPTRKLKGARRTLLKKTGYWVYYAIDPETDRLVVHAVWHGARGRGPRL